MLYKQIITEKGNGSDYGSGKRTPGALTKLSTHTNELDDESEGKKNTLHHATSVAVHGRPASGRKTTTAA